MEAHPHLIPYPTPVQVPSIPNTHLGQILLVVVHLVHVQVLGEVGQIQPGRGLRTKATSSSSSRRIRSLITSWATATSHHERLGGCRGLGPSRHHPRTVRRGPGRDMAQVPQVVIGRRNGVVDHLLVIRRRLVVVEEEGAPRRGAFGRVEQRRGVRVGLGRATGVRVVGRQELQIILTARIRSTAACSSSTTTASATGRRRSTTATGRRGIQVVATATARRRGDGRLEVLEVVPAGQRLEDLGEAPRVHILPIEHCVVCCVPECQVRVTGWWRWAYYISLFISLVATFGWWLCSGGISAQQYYAHTL